MPATQYPNAKNNSEWKKELTEEEFQCLRQAGTEAPGTGEYHTFFPKKGYFACRACKHPLYSSTSKFKDAVGTRSRIATTPATSATSASRETCKGHVFYGENQTPTDERHEMWMRRLASPRLRWRRLKMPIFSLSLRAARRRRPAKRAPVESGNDGETAASRMPALPEDVAD